VNPPLATELAVRRIFLSPGHSYFGRHGGGSVPQELIEADLVECVAGRGLRGDRFFDYKDNYKGQVTLFSAEVFEELRTQLGHVDAQPAALRRNLLVSGGDLNALIGRQFTLQGIVLEGTEECRPCYWMNEAVGPGAEAWLRGRGGLRCRVLTSGWLRRGTPFEPGELTGAVLAGGASRRMGRDKATLPLDNEPLWQRQAHLLRAAGAGIVGIVRQPDQPALTLSAGVSLWHDAVVDAGPLAGLHAALTASTTGWLAVLATDMPCIDASWFQWLRGHCGPDCGAVVHHADGSFEPLAAIYPRAALPEVAARLAAGNGSLQSLISSLVERGQLRAIELPASDAWRVSNWNTPADRPASCTTNLGQA
jgi:molybdopterin-guanine dinucleotide biosynthesis protein A